MYQKGLPEWFIGSCKKILYMFPKAHSAVYVLTAFRIAYYKVHFRSKKAVPLIEKFIAAIQAITMKYIEVKNKLDGLQTKYKRAIAQLDELKKRFSAVRLENERLAAVERDFLQCPTVQFGGNAVANSP